ncbi:MAG: hypothetical protein ACPG7T_06845 [Ilumatobacteraceae bacterium]
MATAVVADATVVVETTVAVEVWADSSDEPSSTDSFGEAVSISSTAASTSLSGAGIATVPSPDEHDAPSVTQARRRHRRTRRCDLNAIDTT